MEFEFEKALKGYGADGAYGALQWNCDMAHDNADARHYMVLLQCWHKLKLRIIFSSPVKQILRGLKENSIV